MMDMRVEIEVTIYHRRYLGLVDGEVYREVLVRWD